MAEIAVVYGILLTDEDPSVVNEVLLKEYGLKFQYGRFIVTTFDHDQNLGQTVSLNKAKGKDWDDRLIRYCRDVGLVKFDIGWHLHVPSQKVYEYRENEGLPINYIPNEYDKNEFPRRTWKRCRL